MANSSQMETGQTCTSLSYSTDIHLHYIHLIMAFLKLVAKQHNELSKEDTPTCSQLYPTLEMLMSDWEELLENKGFVLQISSSTSNYVYFHFELFLVLTHFVGDS